MTAEAVKVGGVTVPFAGVRALTDVHLSVPGGQRRGILGPNGAGKTTLFNVLDGRVRPAAGTVRLLGLDVTAAPTHVRTRQGLGRTFQLTNLLKTLSVRENVLLGCAGRHRRSRLTFWRGLDTMGAVSEAADTLLRSWELWPVRDRAVRDLSYGQQRLVEMVLALSGDPAVLLLDEPTAGLSERESALLADAVTALPAPLTLLLVEHDIELVTRLSDVVTVLAGGRVLAEGSPEHVLTDARVVDSYLGGRGGDHGPR